MILRTFSPPGLLALEPRAFGLVLAAPYKPHSEERDGVAVIGVRGPLMHHDDDFCESYDQIKRRVSAALASTCRAVVLAIDSPGGLVSGCFDTAAELRALHRCSGGSRWRAAQPFPCALRSCREGSF